MRTAIVILNWNGRGFLEQFLPSVVKYSSADAAIIVADNASTDDSVEFLRNHYPDIRLIINSANGGFARGYNEALKLVEAEYYILLNSDIEVTDGWVHPLIELMDRRSEVAACQPVIRSWYRRDEYEYAGAAGGFIDRLGYPFCRGRLFMSMEKDKGQYSNETEIFWATGACMVVRASVYHEFGGFDEDFFAHMEEIDFCWRLKIKGHKIMYCSSSVVYHVGGGTLHKSNPRKTFLNFRNNFFLLYKNLPGNRLFRVFAVRFFLDGVAGTKFLLQGGLRDCFAVIRAHFAFYASIGKLRKKRRGIHPVSVSCIYKRNLVIEHFLRKKKKFADLDSEKFS